MTRAQAEGIIDKQLGAWIVEQRSARGWTQLHLSQQCGIERTSLRRYEAGDKMPVTAYLRLANAFGFQVVLKPLKVVARSKESS